MTQVFWLLGDFLLLFFVVLVFFFNGFSSSARRLSCFGLNSSSIFFPPTLHVLQVSDDESPILWLRKLFCSSFLILFLRPLLFPKLYAVAFHAGSCDV